MTTTRAAERAAWAAAGALATLAALAGLAVHWGRAVEKNEQYGTWQAQPSDDAFTAEVARLNRLEWAIAQRDARANCTSLGCCRSGCFFYGPERVT